MNEAVEAAAAWHDTFDRVLTQADEVRAQMDQNGGIRPRTRARRHHARSPQPSTAVAAAAAMPLTSSRVMAHPLLPPPPTTRPRPLPPDHHIASTSSSPSGFPTEDIANPMLTPVRERRDAKGGWTRI